MVVIVVDMNREAPVDTSFSSNVVSWKKKITFTAFSRLPSAVVPPVVLSV